MNLTFENQGTNTYLVYELKETDEVDTLSLGMLTNNKIPGLASVMYTQMDTKKYIKYNVSAKVPVQQLFSRAVNKKRLLGVFNGIVNAMLSAEEYMIDTNTILVDLNYMFTDVTTCETILVCLPIDSVVKTSALSDLGTLFKNIVFSTQFDQTENCDYVAKLINYLNSTPVFTLDNFKEVLDSLDNPMLAQQQAMTQQQPVMQAQQPMGMPAMSQPVQQVAPTPAPMATPVAPTPQAIPQPAPVAPQMANVPAVPPAPAKGKKNEQIAVPPVPGAAPAAPANPDEKSMSMFSLLCHYNKENAQLYKEQKARKKEQAALAKQQGAPAMPGAPAPAKGKAPEPANNMGFAIPGMPEAPVSAPVAQPAIPTPAPTPVPKPAPAPVPQPAMPQAMPTPAPQPVPMAQPVMQPVPPAPTPTPVAMPQQPMGGSANFGETTVLGMGGGGIGETTVLGVTSMAMELKPFLIRMKNNERIPVDKPVFRIGKEKSYVDYFISDNTAISRSHANIVARDGEYYLVDTNSTNHTYVNNSMIQSNVETKLTTGTKIRFANEEFEFILA